MMIKKKKISKLQEEVNRILFISNYDLKNPPKIVKESYYNEEIEYSQVEKQNENGYPQSHEYVDEYQIAEQDPTKKPIGRPPEETPPSTEEPATGEAVPDLTPGGVGGGETPMEPSVMDSGEETPAVDTTPPIEPVTEPEEEKPEVPAATKGDVESVESDVETVEDYSKKIMTQQAEILTSINDLTSKFGSVDQLSQKVDQISKGLEDIKPESYQDKLEMISVKSGPFNVKLSDYWQIDDDQETEQEPEELTLDKQDIINFDAAEIKNSLFSTGDQEEDEEVFGQRKTGY